MDETTNIPSPAREDERAEADIEELSQKYTGGAYTGRAPGMRRVTFLIEPTRVWYRPPAG